MRIPEWLWNKDAERGTILALLVALVYFTIFGYTDPDTNSLYATNNVPYGVLWTWLNPLWWTGQYAFYLLGFEAVVFVIQWKLVKMGRLSKNLVILNLFTTVYWAMLHVQQQTTVTILAPFIAINPLFALLFIFQKLPLGWSWDLSDAHWACGIQGDCVVYNANRLGVLQNDFFSHIILLFWLVFPMIFWWQRRQK